MVTFISLVDHNINYEQIQQAAASLQIHNSNGKMFHGFPQLAAF